MCEISRFFVTKYCRLNLKHLAGILFLNTAFTCLNTPITFVVVNKYYLVMKLYVETVFKCIYVTVINTSVGESQRGC